jgi:hypothetical protein
MCPMFFTESRSNKEVHWRHTKPTRLFFYRTSQTEYELIVSCYSCIVSFSLGSISLIFRVWTRFLLSKEQIHFLYIYIYIYSLMHFVKICFCEASLCSSQARTPSEIQYIYTKRPAHSFLPFWKLRLYCAKAVSIERNKRLKCSYWRYLCSEPNVIIWATYGSSCGYC